MSARPLVLHRLTVTLFPIKFPLSFGQKITKLKMEKWGPPSSLRPWTIMRAYMDDYLAFLFTSNWSSLSLGISIVLELKEDFSYKEWLNDN